MNISKFFLSSSMEDQIQRYHSSFADKTKDSKSRIKSLQNLVKIYQENQDELLKLYNTNSAEIFELLYNGLINFKRGSLFLSLTSEDEIGNIFKLLKGFISSLSNVRCQALFLNFRDKILLLLYYSLNTIVQLKIRMRAFKILLRVLDVILTFNENDRGLVDVFNRSIEFSLFDKNQNSKFPNVSNYSLQDLISVHGIQKEIAKEIYGEWIKQIQENNRNFVEDKLLNYFFQFWLESTKKIRRWFKICMNSWILPVFEIKDYETTTCFKSLNPLRSKFLERMLTAVFKIIQDDQSEECNISSDILDEVRRVFRICARDLKIWSDLYELYVEIFDVPHKIQLHNTSQDKFLLSLLSEIKDGAFLELDSFTKNKFENNPQRESLYVLNSLSKILETMQESLIYEKNYTLIEETILIIHEIILFGDVKGIIKRFHREFYQIIQNYLQMVMKWEDYLKDSWKKLKEIMRIIFKNQEIFKNLENFLLQRTEDLVTRIHSVDNIKLFDEFFFAELKMKDIRSELILQILLFHHNENCDCSFQTRTQELSDFRNNSLNQLVAGKSYEIWENERMILYKKFKKWLHFMLFLQDEDFVSDLNIYSILGNLFQNVIGILLASESADKGKNHKHQRISPPIHTLLEIFGIYFCLALDFPKFTHFEKFFNNVMSSHEKSNKKEGVLLVSQMFLSLFYEARSEIPIPKEYLSSFIKFVHIILFNFTMTYYWKLLSMVCLHATVRFLTLNLPGVKMLIPLYVNVAKSIILEESFRVKEYSELAKILGQQSHEKAINMIKINAIDILKLSYELSNIYFKMPDFKIQSKTFGNHKRFIFEVTVEILNRIAYENEIFKNFENPLKKDIFSLFLVILKDFEEEKFYKIWELLLKVLNLGDNNYYTHLTIMLFKDLLTFKDKFIVIDKFYLKKLIESFILKMGHFKILSTNEVQLLMDAILHWILYFSFESFDHNVLQFLTETLRILSNKIKLIFLSIDNFHRADYKVFNSFFLKNAFNFPAKNQGINNTRSIFNEETFKYAEPELHLAQMQDQNEESKMKQIKNALTPSSGEIHSLLKEERQKRRTIRSVSGFKPDEDDNDSRAESPSPRLKCYMKIKKNSDIYRGSKSAQFALFYHELVKIDKVNHHLSSQIYNQLNHDAILLSIHDSNLLTFLKSHKEDKIYVITRNMASKYFWEFNCFHFWNEPRMISLFNQNKKAKASRIKMKKGRSKSVSASFIKIALEKDFSDFSFQLAKFDDLQYQYEKEHRSFFDYQYFKELKEQAKNCKKNENKASARRYLRKASLNSSAKKEHSHSEARSKIQGKLAIRLFLQNLGFDYSHMNVNYVDCYNDQFQNLLNILDFSPERECLKVGIVFVSPYERNQNDILRSNKGSHAYKKFLKSLGEKVILERHLGYMGGLKANLDGNSTIYYSDSSIELVFHVSTMMPLKEEDEQQVSKKRHIGNDSVNIIWCEDYPDYKHHTIVSHFTSIYIIIYPLKDGLFRLQIVKKAHIPIFFPWLDNMVLEFQNLVHLVRLAAINGSKVAREINASTTTHNYAKDFLIKSNDKNLSLSLSKYNCILERKKIILDIIEKFGSKNSKSPCFPYLLVKNHGHPNLSYHKKSE